VGPPSSTPLVRSMTWIAGGDEVTSEAMRSMTPVIE
jgi:hypothetical protein